MTTIERYDYSTSQRPQSFTLPVSLCNHSSYVLVSNIAVIKRDVRMFELEIHSLIYDRSSAKSAQIYAEKQLSSSAYGGSEVHLPLNNN